MIGMIHISSIVGVVLQLKSDNINYNIFYIYTTYILFKLSIELLLDVYNILNTLIPEV